jgi:ABC-type multidrug transport system fused ATPase/permease subunit
MSRFEILRKLIMKHRFQLTITYVLFSLEMLGALLRPFFLGMAVNDLMKGSYHGLILLCAVHLLWLVIGTIRHMYDTRTYSAIYISLVTRFLSRRQIQQSEVSKLSAHSTLAREFVDFLEHDLVYVIEAVYNLFGSLILLFFYEPSIVILCFAILLPVLAISFIYGRKMQRFNRFKNDELEKQVDIIGSGDKKAIGSHFNNLRKWQIRVSDQEAWSFGVMELMVMVVIAIALIITHNVSGTAILAGNLIGIYTYLLKFASGLDTIPYTVQRLSSLTDITRRIELQAEDFPEEVVNTVKPIKSARAKKIKLQGPIA